MGEQAVRLIQLSENGKGLDLIAGGSEYVPEDIVPGSAGWQRWVIENIRKLVSKGTFKGKEVVSSLPAQDTFVTEVKVPKSKEGQVENYIISKIKNKLPFGSDDIMIKTVPLEDDNYLIIVTEREKINRHLAIYEKANLQIKSITVWPLALINSYIRFFGRRKSDLNSVVGLIDIKSNCTNVVICRYKNALYARSIPIGSSKLDNEEVMSRLILELNGCRRQFAAMNKRSVIERIIFLSGEHIHRDICATIAQKLEMPAQMGDCLAALKTENLYERGIDRRNCKFSWATAFGLSLS